MKILALILTFTGCVAAMSHTFPLDYSTVGYRQSSVTLPDADVVVFVKWQSGDQSARIQKAIDYVSSRKMNKKSGLRGAVLLDKGEFSLSEPLRIHTAGVVLRGTGRNETILMKKGIDRGAVVYIESPDKVETLRDTFSVVSPCVPIGDTTFKINADHTLRVGDMIVIDRPSTKEWIAMMGCSDFGGGKDLGYWGWHPGEIDVRWHRTVTKVEGTKISIDAPLSMTLDSKYGSASVFGGVTYNRVYNAGVENLTIDSDYDKSNSMDENHAWDGVYISNAIDVWVRMVNFRHLAGSAVVTQRSAAQVTVEDCISTEPVSELGGSRRRTFYCMGERCLFQRCYSEHGIHDFSTGMSAAGPNVFSQCESYESLGYSGSVGSLCTGVLFDNVNIDGNDIKFCNLYLEGYGIGWNSTNSTIYQSNAAGIYADSLPDGSNNIVYGCWAQFNGTGDFMECNNHVKPWSLFAEQLEKRLGRDVSTLCRTLVRKTNSVSNNPTYEEAQRMVELARVPRVTLKNWIINNQSISASVSADGAIDVDNLPDIPQLQNNPTCGFIIKDGKLLFEGNLLTGKRHNTPWWNGRVRYSTFPKLADGVTRFVPGMEGQGTTTRVDSVINHLKNNNVVVYNQNYGLWYDRRRDDHERVRRRDGDVWAPFYEQPFARSGKGKAWDGLSKYDLEKLNPWYVSRIKELAIKGERNGLIVINQHYFQHNILEAGAHWVDCPWRPVNNINGTLFPEPVPFAGDKRVWMAEYFYDIDNPVMRKLHRQYIIKMLDAFADVPNIVHSIGEEYTGPYSFTAFWLRTVGEWERATGRDVKVSLSCNKDIQDSIMQDPELRRIVEIINIEQWWYAQNDVYAPEGGKNLAPRQYLRRIRPGKVSFDEVYRCVRDCRNTYPDKAVVYYGANYPQFGWAVLMAGGSCPDISVRNTEFLHDVATMSPADSIGGLYTMKNNKGDILAYIPKDITPINIKIDPGHYVMYRLDGKTGILNKVGELSVQPKNEKVTLSGAGALYLRRK
ncbi:MAG: DUF6298 domain-containing protein [Prevotella sp.]|nr:DUF6298 domain-containing protein [Prevotella sp.]